MITDERDESFREMAALGNLKAVTAYIRSGICIDGQNKMNGWTALHWACKRGHARIVDVLLRAGADSMLKNTQGQTPLDLSKSDEIRALFATIANIDVVTLAPTQPAEGDEKTFTPNYLVNPDLTKAWGVPEDAMLPSQGDSSYVQQLQQEASISTSAKRTQRIAEKASPANLAAGSAQGQQGPVATAASADEEREILVYKQIFADDNLVGSVLVGSEKTVNDLAAVIREELDGIPSNFSIARNNGRQTIPISARQHEFSVTKVFRSADDAAVIVAKE
ncbi:hypothetical protein DL89DRAFT_165602 [Linderina pennispora]|uniref:Uncharacterized protein n=1 Tax=Linderina pennispora TaxID=61395 RepID=A0A1Y1W9C6_9FUNG|nr:uncharacterized protein DL89DRAFT_165602 [Linderina pennispora]ORX69764.1 hypothetical protein DL89DRAFT_165602 [Linderina pennispora]